MDEAVEQETPADTAFYKFVLNVHVEHQSYLKKAASSKRIAAQSVHLTGKTSTLELDFDLVETAIMKEVE